MLNPYNMAGKKNTKKGRVKFVDENTAFSQGKKAQKDSTSDEANEDDKSIADHEEENVFNILDNIVSVLPSGEVQNKAKHFMLLLNMDPHVKITENGRIYVGRQEGEHLTAVLSRLFLPALKTEEEKSNHNYLEHLLTHGSATSNLHSRASAAAPSENNHNQTETKKKKRKTRITLEKEIGLRL